MPIKDVHTEHCCANCGCKYGEDAPADSPWDEEPVIGCSVVSGRKKQSYPCGQTCVCYQENSCEARLENVQE